MNKWQKLHAQYAQNAFQGNGHAYTQEAKIAELDTLTAGQRDDLGKALLDFHTVADLQQWLDQH